MRSPAAALRREGLSRLAWCAVAFSVALTTAAALVVGLAYSVYAERAEGDNRRYPMAAAERSDATLTLLLDFDHLPDNQSHSVVYVQPDGPDAPLPPGLSRWLEPGEVAVSPEFATVASSFGVIDLYGTPVLTIGPAGLGALDERLVYVGSAGLEGVSGAHPYAGFGAVPPATAWDVSSTGALFGESITITSLRWLVMVIVVLSLAPAGLCLMTVSGYVRHTRARRELLLDSLGVPVSVRRRLQIRVTGPAVAAGVALGSAGVLVPTILGIRAPVTGFRLDAALVWSRPGVFVVCVLLAASVSVGLLAITAPPRRLANRPGLVVQTHRPWWLVAGPLAVLFAVRGPDLIDPEGGWTWAIVYWTGVLASFLLVPFSIAVFVTSCARAVQELARRRGMPSTVAALGWVANAPRTALRSAVALTVMLGVVFQVTAATQGTSEDLRSAVALQEQVGDRLLVVGAHGAIASEDLTESVPGTALALLEVDPNSPEVTLVAGCAALRALALGCEPGTVPVSSLPTDVAPMASYVGASDTIRVRPQESSSLEPGQEAWWFRLDGADLPRTAARQAAYEAVGLDVSVSVPGQSWIVGATNQAQEGRWVPVLAAVGLAATLVAVLIDLQGRVREHARRSALLTVVLGRRRHLWVMAGLVTAPPLLVTAALAFLAHWAVIGPVVITVPSTPTPAEAILPGVVIGVVLTAPVAWVLVARAALVAARDWLAQDDAPG